MIAPAGLPKTSMAESTRDSAVEDETNSGFRAVFAAASSPGDCGTLGPYRIVAEIGRGGMGAVYEAIDTRIGRRVALKIIRPEYAASPAARERFLREARAAAQISHDNVVTIFEADERGGMPYMAMPHLEGEPLDAILERGGVRWSEAVRIGRETAAGLAAAHALGLIHRDIKPSNLWIEAPNGRVKILDFGLAKAIDSDADLTRPGAILGTPSYMSPEQARGQKLDARTDLFSLGAVLYRLVAGRLPFPGSTPNAALIALATEEPVPLRQLVPGLPEPLVDLIHRLLDKRPEARPASAADVIAVLNSLPGDDADDADRKSVV